ncbi:Bug family tripartite tricarboxylate transporter substrate binding protein [Polaromonas sp. UC242_47]|uniref:Bug family tripartite tricarboxylate transporter substrate binding protein n=1 Tax=Polaromonas sp. UC242_47 TaxID=3374626 RepID=UPI0037A6D222
MTPLTFRKIRRFLCVSSLAALALPFAHAQTDTYPNRVIRLVVPYASGGPTDQLARSLGQRMQESLGQPVIIENKPGAGSILGVDYVAKSPADGYTLLFTASAALVVNPSLNTKLPYQAKDFAPVSSAGSYTMFLAVNPKLPFNSVGELITYAKRNPGKLSFGSAGNGTSNHLAGELLKKMAGIDLMHVPYKGNAAAMTDVMGGNISMMFDLPATTLPHARAGNIKLLGTTGLDKNPLAPQVPTIASSGVPGYDVTSWFGVLAPAKTPPEIVQKLSKLIVTILKDPAISAKLAGQGYEVFGSMPKKLADMMAADTKLWAELIREANIKLE